MNENQFITYMQRARRIEGDYSIGYQKGLRRHYHGESFGTVVEHDKFMRLGLDGDYRTEMGRGYRDGFSGKPPSVV